MPGHLSRHSHGLGGDFSAMLLVDVGTAFWFGVYVLAIVQGLRQRTYAIPLVAICANFSWELLAAVVTIAPVALWRIGDIVWLCLDAVIVWTLLRYGRAQQSIPEIRRFYYPVIAVTFLFALVVQYALDRAFEDRYGFIDAYLIAVMMSVLFFLMYFQRRNADGYAYGIAWCKFLGNGLTSAGFVVIYQGLYRDANQTRLLLYVLCVACVMLDAGYVALLAHARRTDASSERVAAASTAV
ncbi:MAG: DUF2101 family protein [Myxococcales bacterium]|nr:DUF2101 family protein [Myxococcales bacterium]